MLPVVSAGRSGDIDDPYGSDEDTPQKSYCGPTKEACGTPFPSSQEPRCSTLKNLECKTVGKYTECYCQLNPPEFSKDDTNFKKIPKPVVIPAGRQFQKLYPKV